MASSLLSSHLEQISLCSSSIADLHFPESKAFANALLAPHDITALIRDTEPHERALFSIAPPPVPSKTQIHQFSSTISASVNSSQPRAPLPPAATRPPRRGTAVAAVLGGETYRRIRNGATTDQSTRYGRPPARDQAELDVDLLLNAAEKLLNVYPIPGAFDKIARLRSRHNQLSANIAHYEERVASQTSQLDHMNQPRDYDDCLEPKEHENAYEDDFEPIQFTNNAQMTAEDLLQEEQEIRALEWKKKALEDRVTGMEKDIGGLAR